MALQFNIPNLDDVDEAVRPLYKKAEGGEGFELDVDVGPLKRAKQQEKEMRKSAEARVRELEDQATATAATVEALRKKATTAETAISTYLVDQEADRIAAEISSSPRLLTPWVKERLRGELVDGKMKMVVLDKDGLPSESNTDDLKREFQADEQFAPIITSSRASGGGTTGSASSRRMPTKEARTMSSEERLQLKKENPSKFRELFNVN